MARVCIYVRVSSEEQLKGHSLGAQRELCEQFARARGWEIVAVFEGEGESAKSDRRRGFQRAVDFIRTRQADVFLTHKVDRFARNLMDALNYWHEFQRLGVQYCSVAEQFDFTTPQGWLMMVMLAALAELFLKNLSQETAKGKRARALKGLWNGDLPFGYRAAARDRAELDPETAPGARLAFETYAQGQHDDGGIARLLNAAGYRTQGKGRRGAQPFSKDTVRSMLANPFYAGQVSYKGETYAGQHPALIAPEVWEACQMVRRRKRLHPKRANPETRVYPLAGRVTCLYCESPLRASHTQSGHRYYRDPARDRGRTCIHRSHLRAEVLEAAVAQILTGWRLTPEERAQALAQAGGPLEARLTQGRRARAEQKRQRALQLFVDGLIEREKCDRLLTEAQTELDALRPVAAPDLETAERLLADLPRLYRAATDAEKQRIVRAMVERVYTRGEQVVAIQPTPEAYHLLAVRWLRTRRGPSSEPAITRQPAGYWLSPPATPLSVLTAAVG